MIRRILVVAGFLPALALATSGDAHRFILNDGIRYSHILDLWGANSIPSHKSVRFPSLVMLDVSVTMIQ